jgi:LacI family transcriptional regulator
MNLKKTSPRVLFLTPYLDQDILRGVADIAFERSWRLDASIRRQWMIPNHWDGDGIISGNFDTSPPLRKFLEQHRHIPTVFVDQTEAEWGATVIQNFDSQARMALEHLKQQGYKRFHYIQVFNDGYSKARGEAFLKLLHSENLSIGFSHIPYEKLHAHDLDPQFLKSLSEHSDPLGVFCANDQVASILAQACLTHGFNIPQQLGLIGVDNDPIETELAMIPLSSVDNQRYQHGLEVAKTLQQLMDQPHMIIPVQRVEPKGVVVRQSTQLCPVEPIVVSKAKALLAANFANRKFRAQHICDQLFISRRRLHDTFIAHCGMSVADLLLDYRIKCAEQLLRQESMSIRQVAQQSGFAGPEYMSRVFKRQLGRLPTQLRLR